MNTNPQVFDIRNLKSLLVTLDIQILMCLQYDSVLQMCFWFPPHSLGIAYPRRVVKALILFVPLTTCLLESYTPQASS